MKRLAIIFMSLYYLLITSGFVVNVHYCMGSFAGVEWGADAHSDVCSKCGMEENDFCCKTDQQHYKLDSEHQPSFANFLIAVDVVDDVVALPFYQDFLSPLLTDKAVLSNLYHAPPDPKLNEVFLYHCNFRI